MNDDIKMAFNIMQSHIVPETASDNVLYIFENETEKIRYNQLLIINHKNTHDKILKSISDLCSQNG